MPLKITNFSNAILQNISFELAYGDNLIILGSNGVGKTTLAKVLSGIIASDSVNIDGLSPSKTFGVSRAKLINYIPPKLEIFDSFISVREFLELSCLQSHLSIEKVLSTLQLTALASQKCQTLSSGQAQLLLIASALLHEAKYTIFDEPTANLDPQKMQMLFKLLQNAMPKESKIIITHNLNLAYKLGFDILFLDQGKIAFHGASEAFFEATHLHALYDGAVIKENNTIMVKL
jgi:iron complex transport system ATP-binding protein